MGYFSCNLESAVATCDSYNFELLTKKSRNKNPTRPFKITEFEYTDLYSSTNGFSHENLLGKGSHGSVYKTHIHKFKLTAAVKVTKQSHPTIENEIDILSRIYHPHIVNLLGFAIDPNKFRKLIVVEHMPNGSLHDVLHGPGKPPGWMKRTRFALQTAIAVQFLHESDPQIIHRDIKSTNILIDSKFNSRLGDLGLALRGEDVKVKGTPPAGTLGYLDPGYLAPGDVSSKSDVFSFGILILEIISGRKAIDLDYSPSSVIDWALPIIKSGDFVTVCDPRIGAPENLEVIRRMLILAVKCVRPTAVRRPEMAEVVECLKSVCKGMKMQSPGCMNLRRRVGSVVEYEPLDEKVEFVMDGRKGTRRNGKVSNVPGAQVVNLVGRSNSSGRRVGSGMKMPTVRLLSKSRSMGILQVRKIVEIDNTKFEESMVLVDRGVNIVLEEKP